MDDYFPEHNDDDEFVSTAEFLKVIRSLAREVLGKNRSKRRPSSKWVKRLRHKKAVGRYRQKR